MQKYFVPSKPEGSLKRDYLLKHLDNALKDNAKLAFIKAPSGYGKTYLMIDYAHHISGKLGIPVWTTLDEDDNSPEAFFVHSITQLKEIGVLRESFFYDENISLLRFMDRFIEEVSLFDKSVYLFYENYQHINNQVLVDLMQQLLLVNSTNIKIVVSSRLELPFPAAKFYVNERIVKITHDDLGFSKDEIKDFAQLIQPEPLSDDDAVLVLNRTGGWPAIVSLAIKNVHLTESDHDKLFAKANSNLSEFFYQEVICNISEEERFNLISLSVSHYLCEPLAEILIGENDYFVNLAGTVPIIHLENQHLSHRFDWFMLQPLLRNYLYHQLTSVDDELARILHERVGDWFLAQKIYVEAVEHYINAKQYQKAVDILVPKGINIIARGYFPRFKKLIHQLPYEYLISNVSLLASQGWYYALTFQHTSALSTVQTMDNLLLDNPDLVEQFGVQILGVKGAIAHFSDSLYQHIDAIKAELEKSPLAIPYVENSLRSILAFDYLKSDNFEGLTHLATQGLFFAKGGSLFFSTVYLKVTFSMMYFALGDFEKCREVCCEAQDFIASQEHDSRLGHIINVIRGMLAYVEGNLEQAKSLFDESGEMVVNLADPSFLAWYFPTHIQLLTDLGLLEQREMLVEQLMDLSRSRHIPISRTPLIYEAIDCYLNQNNYDDAYALYDSFKHELALLSAPKNGHLLFNEEMIDCLVLVSKGRYSKVRKILTDLSHQYELSGRVLQQLKCLIMLVNVYIKNTKTSLAKQTLKTVVTFASKHNIVQYLGRLDATAIGYLSEWSLTEWSPKRKAFMDLVCQRFETQESKLPFSTANIEPLTSSEQKVMELLALGYSNQQIADKLSLSINTVKTHLKVSYAKLGVNNRIQANILFSQIHFSDNDKV
ncbi:LuxR C-terminal-related transcriptional regulator [Colwellia sp. 12G3]|uniref:LuxR C-terminal-related transcriptional regulator n=1 Tax=Colwellia sp. 12G3 TaxID=2058299 RepID=UPI000C3350C1|nr:LuxR C-terminal-related transcriptional regulator [Colwellia sp. 12G3]PKI16183.1 hypothetical protein CXF71_11105 [Colwellia sp. 12G3]